MTATNGIPFLDLISPHAELKEELQEVFKTALATAGFIGGPMVQGFEKDFAAYCEAQHCIGVGNGTDALRFALIAAGVQSGDVVITVPNTFIATTRRFRRPAPGRRSSISMSVLTTWTRPNCRSISSANAAWIKLPASWWTAKPASVSPPLFPCIYTGKWRTWMRSGHRRKEPPDGD